MLMVYDLYDPLFFLLLSYFKRTMGLKGRYFDNGRRSP